MYTFILDYTSSSQIVASMIGRIGNTSCENAVDCWVCRVRKRGNGAERWIEYVFVSYTHFIAYLGSSC